MADVSDLFKESINLSVRFGDFFRGLGWGPFSCVCFLIAVFWQNHYNVGFLWEQGTASGECSPAVFRLSLLHEQNLVKGKTPFSSFCRAQLFSEPSAPLPNPIAVRSSQVGAGGSVAQRRRHGTGILALSSPYLFGSVP